LQRAEFLTSKLRDRQSEYRPRLALLPATHMAAPITHFIPFEVGDFIDGP